MNDELVWVFDTGDDVPSGPYSSEAAAQKDIRVMTARNCAGELIECSEPYQMKRSELKKLVEKYFGESSLDESMSQKQKAEFYARLHTEKVHFQYIEKKTNSMRKAYGTLIPEYLPPPKNAENTKQEARNALLKKARQQNEHQVWYYDLDKKWWRSFLTENFDKYLD